MLIDYDLVIVGTSTYAYKLVDLASRLQTRVAWVWDADCQIKGIEQIHQAWRLLKIKLREKPREQRATLFNQIFEQEVALILANSAQEYFGDSIQSKGVDLIYGQSQFVSGHSQNFDIPKKQSDRYILEVTNSAKTLRYLSARAYVIADDAPTNLGKIFGLASHDYLTAAQLFATSLPSSIAVLGSDAHACAIAQSLNFMGVQTSLVTSDRHVLPDVDVAIARTLQAQLEAEGVNIYTQSQLTAVSKTEQNLSRLWIGDYGGERFIECDRVVVPIAPTGLMLPHQPEANPYIWQCRTEREFAQIIEQTLQTSLWQIWQRSPMVLSPEMLITPTEPPIAQVGLTEELARSSSRQVLVLEQADPEWGICKIICDRQGSILGASMCGDGAVAVINALAIAMQGKVKAQDLHNFHGLDVAALWQDLHLQSSDQLKLKDWFTFRRDWRL